MEIFVSAACGLIISFAYWREPWWVKCLLALTAGILVGIIAQAL